METEKVKTKFVELLTRLGLTDGGRKLFTDNEISILSINIEKTPNENINIKKFLKQYKYNPHKKKLVNQHIERYGDEYIEAIDEDPRNLKLSKIYIKPAFFELLFSEIEEEQQSEQFTEEEIEDEEQGFVYLSPSYEYNQYMSKFEQFFAKTSNKYDPSKILLKNKTRFTRVKSKIDVLAEMKFPKLYRLLIEKELTSQNMTKPLSYYVQATNGHEYQAYHTWCQESRTTSILPIGVMPTEDNKKEFKNAMLSKEYLMQNPNFALEYHVYEGKVLFDDNTEQEIMIESFMPLRTTYYDAYGYTRTGTVTGLAHIKVCQIENIDVNIVKEEDIFTGERHAMIEFYRFLFNYIRAKRVPLKKLKSDTIFWNEVLRTLVQFSGFDEDRRCHAIYAGFQDVGKSYITTLFNKIKFTNWQTVESANMTPPGLFGSSNRDIKLPDNQYKGIPLPGAFASDSILLEEVGRAILSPTSSFNAIIEALKLNLFEREINLVKAGGGKFPRNAYMTMTMNYDKEWVDSLRKRLLKVAKDVEDDAKKGNIILGEDKGINLLSDEAQVRNNVLYELCMKYDIFLPFDEYPTTEFEFNHRTIDQATALAFRKAIERFRELFISEDIHTGLQNNFLKRTPYSLYGSTEETKKEFDFKTAKKDYDSGVLESRASREKDLYIPNLAHIIRERIRKFGVKMGLFDEKSEYMAYINKVSLRYLEMLHYKYPSYFAKVGGETVSDFMKKNLLVLMLINNEEKPSVQSLQLVEKWYYLQCTSITSIQAANYRHLEKAINYIANDENYVRILEELEK